MGPLEVGGARQQFTGHDFCHFVYGMEWNPSVVLQLRHIGTMNLQDNTICYCDILYYQPKSDGDTITNFAKVYRTFRVALGITFTVTGLPS